MFRRVLAQAAACAALIAGSQAWASTSSNGVTTTELPGGGTIAYAQMPKQHSAKDAMGKVLQYIETRYGARPNVTQVVQSRDGNLQEAIYTLTPKSGGGELSGVALVVTRPNMPIEGAMMTDQSDRFRKTFGSMLDKLTAQAGAADGGDKAPKPSSSASAKSDGAQTAFKGPSGPTAPAEALHQTDFGSGSVGLPVGWNITTGHSGIVKASGPNGELAAFGVPITIIDPRNPQGRAIGGFAQVPYGSDAVTTFNASVAYTNRGHKVPSYNFSTVKDVSGSRDGRAFAMVGDADFHDGKGQVHAWVQMGISAPMTMGTYLLTISEVVVPESRANAEAATVAKMFGSYKVNVGAAVNQVNADTAMMQRTFAQSMEQAAAINDAGERMTAGMSDYLRDDTVVRDNLLNGHARVSDDLADGLVDADPNRFEKVPLSDYVKGIDY